MDFIERIIKQNKIALDRLAGHTEPNPIEFQVYAAKNKLELI